MKKSRFSEVQIVGILEMADAGMSVDRTTLKPVAIEKSGDVDAFRQNFAESVFC